MECEWIVLIVVCSYVSCMIDLLIKIGLVGFFGIMVLEYNFGFVISIGFSSDGDYYLLGIKRVWEDDSDDDIFSLGFFWSCSEFLGFRVDVVFLLCCKGVKR